MHPEESEDFRKWRKSFVTELRELLDSQPPELKALLYKHKLVKELLNFFKTYILTMWEIGYWDGRKHGVCLGCNDKGFTITREESVASREAGFDGYLYHEETYFTFCTQCEKGRRLARHYDVDRCLPSKVKKMLRGNGE